LNITNCLILSLLLISILGALLGRKRYKTLLNPFTFICVTDFGIFSFMSLGSSILLKTFESINEEIIQTAALLSIIEFVGVLFAFKIKIIGTLKLYKIFLKHLYKPKSLKICSYKFKVLIFIFISIMS